MKRHLFFVFVILFSCQNKQNEKSTVPDSTETKDTIVSSILPVGTDTVMTDSIKFGFCNKEGDYLLIYMDDKVNSPASFTKAISHQGKLMDISFVTEKQATAADNGRQNYYNFDNCGGMLYKAVSEKANSENSVVFVTDYFLSKHSPITLLPVENKPLSSDLRSKIESDKGNGWKISETHVLAQLEKELNVYLILFDNKGDSALASMAMIRPDGIVYLDFPAKYDEVSTWRVDDGGEFYPGNYKVIAAFRNDDVIELVTDWYGAEGTGVTFLREEGNQFTDLFMTSFYTAPE